MAQAFSPPAGYWCGVGTAGPSFAYSLPVHPAHTRRDRLASLPPCCLYGAVIPRAPPLGPGRALTLPCGWNRARTSRAGASSARSATWTSCAGPTLYASGEGAQAGTRCQKGHWQLCGRAASLRLTSQRAALSQCEECEALGKHDVSHSRLKLSHGVAAAADAAVPSPAPARDPTVVTVLDWGSERAAADGHEFDFHAGLMMPTARMVMTHNGRDGFEPARVRTPLVPVRARRRIDQRVRRAVVGAAL